MHREDWVDQQFNQRYEKEEPAATREDPKYRSIAERSFRSKLNNEWYARNEQAYIEGKPVPDSAKPQWAVPLKRWAELRDDYVSTVQDSHRRAVQEALAEGKPVPPEVLADYPNLKPPAPQPPKPPRSRRPKGQPQASLRDFMRSPDVAA
jgi:hypothetical protein